MCKFHCCIVGAPLLALVCGNQILLLVVQWRPPVDKE